MALQPAADITILGQAALTTHTWMEKANRGSARHQFLSLHPLCSGTQGASKL